jgi:hypothetical protein
LSTTRGIRFTIHPDARAENLARLLALNHERHAQELAAGQQDNRKSPSKAKGARKKDGSPENDGLFEDE